MGEIIKTAKLDTIGNTSTIVYFNEFKDLKADFENLKSDHNNFKSDFENFKSDYEIDQKYIAKDFSELHKKCLSLELELHNYKAILCCTVIAVVLTMVLTVVVR